MDVTKLQYAEVENLLAQEAMIRVLSYTEQPKPADEIVLTRGSNEPKTTSNEGSGRWRYTSRLESWSWRLGLRVRRRRGTELLSP